MLPELDAIAEIVVETMAAVMAPLQAELVATKTALAALQATIAPADAGTLVAALDRRVEALLADVGTVRERIAAVEVKTLQPGPPGAPGKDGADGFGFDDLDLVIDDARKGCFLRFLRGDQVKEFRLPTPFDVGPYREGEHFERGNVVSYGSSYWIAKMPTTDRPGDGATAWRLTVKKGKDGKPGADGPPGPPGRDCQQVHDDNRRR